MSLSQYITDTRMNKAVELIKEGKFSINEASEKVGFSNRKLSQFTKVFNNKFGVTPFMYSRALKTNHT